MPQFSRSYQPERRGRKPKRSRTGLVAAAEQRLRDRLPELLDALVDAALGAFLLVETEAGAKRVYRRPPDTKAAIYLVERVLGKPVSIREDGTAAVSGAAVSDHGDQLRSLPRGDGAALVGDRGRLPAPRPSRADGAPVGGSEDG